MNTYKKILVPTDFSGGAESAYAIAVQLAHKFGGKVDMMHVLPSGDYLRETLKKIPVAVDPDEDVIPDIVKDAEIKLKAILNRVDEPIRGKVHIGKNRKASDSIIHYANDEGYDLIVMGSKGEDQSIMKRGSTTLRTLRNSKIPVIAVDKGTTAGDIKRILLPTDSSQLSLSSLPHAAALAHAFGAEITLFYVMELYGGITEDSDFKPENHEKEKVYEQLMSRLNYYLQDRKPEGIQLKRSDKSFLDSLKAGSVESEKYIPLKTVIIAGYSVHYEIEKYAEKQSDLVVMATHGHSGFAHLFLGSMTEKVVQNLPKPVMTTRPTETEFDRAEKSSIGMVTYDPLP